MKPLIDCSPQAYASIVMAKSHGSVDMTSAYEGPQTMHQSLDCHHWSSLSLSQKIPQESCAIRLPSCVSLSFHTSFLRCQQSDLLLRKTEAASWRLCRAASCWPCTTQVKGKAPGLDQLTVSSALLCTGGHVFIGLQVLHHLVLCAVHPVKVSRVLSTFKLLSTREMSGFHCLLLPVSSLVGMVVFSAGLYLMGVISQWRHSAPAFKLAQLSQLV